MHVLSIERGLFAADDRTALCVRSIVASLMWMAELLCVCDRHGFVAADGTTLQDYVRIRGLLARS